MTTQEVSQLLATLQSDVYNGKINPVITPIQGADAWDIYLGDGTILKINGRTVHDLLNR